MGIGRAVLSLAVVALLASMGEQARSARKAEESCKAMQVKLVVEGRAYCVKNPPSILRLSYTVAGIKDLSIDLVTSRTIKAIEKTTNFRFEVKTSSNKILIILWKKGMDEGNILEILQENGIGADQENRKETAVLGHAMMTRGMKMFDIVSPEVGKRYDLYLISGTQNNEINVFISQAFLKSIGAVEAD